MLRKDLKYICIDFETTGLDAEHDEAIQIGIVVFDHAGRELDSFSSFIKPQKPLAELKDMVRVVTGLSMESLVDAPSFSEISKKVESFFDGSSVIIGHNVQFDISVLKQHLNVPYHAVIDTFPLAQAMMPFSQSYALEVLHKSMEKHKTAEADGAHHDALYDAYATKAVFLECINRIDKTTDAYPQIINYIKSADSSLTKIMDTTTNDTVLEKKIPVLSKIYATDKKLLHGETLAKEAFSDKAKHYTGNISLKETLKMLPKENVIFAFSQRNKIQIAKNLLHEIGLTQVDTGVQHTFDANLLHLFFQKKQKDQGELYFGIKYFYHAYMNHSTIDLNNMYDRKIYHALKEKDISEGIKPVELLTHEQLYEKMRALQIMPYTTIFFFDQDRRYDTHMKWEQKPFDLHTLLQITDSLIYRDKLLQPSHISPREAIHNTLVIFIGIWQTEIAGLLKDVSNSAVEVDNMLENTYFYKCKLLLEQMSQTFADLENKVEADDYRIFMEKRERFISIISASCGIMTKLQGDEVHFLVKTLHSFLDYSEFQGLFDMYQTIFLSHIKHDWPALIKSNESFQKPLIADRPGKDKLQYTNKNIYLFSNNKQMSQEVLVRLHSHKPEKHKVHGENITGGKGKNIFAIKSSQYNVILGGYDFFLQCVAQRISIDKIYTLCINGPFQHIISADLIYYGNTSLL